MDEGESCRSLSLSSSASGGLDKLSDGELGAYIKEKRPELLHRRTRPTSDDHDDHDNDISFEEILRKCRERARNHQIKEHYRNSCSCEYYDIRRVLPPPLSVEVSPEVATTATSTTTTADNNDIDDDEAEEEMAADIAYKQSFLLPRIANKQSFLPRYKVGKCDDDSDDDDSSSVNSILDLDEDDDDDDSVYNGLDVEEINELYKHYWQLEKKVPTAKKSGNNATTKSKEEEAQAEEEEDALLNSLRRQLFVSC